MSRIRWFRFVSDDELSVLTRQLSKRVFKLEEPVSSGFRIDAKSEKAIAGQFVHKRTFDQKVVLPSGQEFSQEIVGIEITKFGVSCVGSDRLLHTVDAPRSLTPFLSSLSEATKFSCAISPIEIDVGKWLFLLRQNCGPITTTFLDVWGLNIAQNVEGRLAISGTNDVYAALEEFVGKNVSKRIDSAKIRLRIGAEPFVVEISRRATIKTPQGFPLEGVDQLRSAMLLAESAK